MSTAVAAESAAGGLNPLRQTKPRYGEKVIRVILFAAAAVSILTTFGIVISVLVPSLEFFAEIPITEFLFTTTWTPLFADPQYGVLPLIMGTMVITAIAVLIAIPLGLGSAIYLSEYAKPKARKILKPTLEVLAGIPTVVFGFFALEFITVFVLKPIFPGIQVFNALSAGIVMGIMIIPTIASLSEDAMAAVPGGLRDGAYALGATKRQVALRVVVPAALSGIVAAFVILVGGFWAWRQRLAQGQHPWRSPACSPARRPRAARGRPASWYLKTASPRSLLPLARCCCAMLRYPVAWPISRLSLSVPLRTMPRSY